MNNSRLLAFFFIAFLSCTGNNYAVKGNSIPGAQIQFSKTGLNYMADVAIDYLNSLIPSVSIPDIEGFLKFTYHLSNIKIEEFNIPKTSDVINFFPPDKLGVNFDGVSARMSAHYQVKVKVGFIHVSKSGTVDVKIDKTSVDASVAITSSNGHPYLTSDSCKANFGVFDIKFHGDLLDDIIDLFKREIEKHFKSKIEGVICKEIENIESDKGNQILGSFPLDIGLGGTFKGFHINYGLTSNTEISPISFTIPIEGLIYFEGHENDTGVPKPNDVVHPYNTEKYLCIDFDGDRVLGSAAYAFEVSNLSHFMIDDNILKLFPDNIKNFFKCTCDDGLCIGELIPEIKKNCQPGKSVAIDCSAIAFPGFHFNSTGVYVNGTGNGNFQIVTPDGYNMGLFDLYMDVGVLLESDLKITDWVISGDVELYEYHFEVKNSAIGEIQTKTIQKIIDEAIKYLIVGIADGILKNGIPLPKINHLNITNPQFIFGKELLSVCADFKLSL
uniref:BPI1 domain-containing protein n=1 Tax=Parastrongyloides trichosuri TaxID=131310 RepID=A0A0N4Z788_PARTI